MNTFSRRIQEIERFRKQNDFANAMQLCEALIKDFPDEPEVYRELAATYATQGRAVEAAEILAKAIVLESDDVGNYFMQGRYYLNGQEFIKAIDSLTRAIELEIQQGKEYFSKTAYFFRAEAYVKIRQNGKALADLEHVPDDYMTYFSYGKRTKADVLQDAMRNR